MQEKEPHVTASYPKKRSVCYGKTVMGYQEPCADASEGHFDRHKGGLPIAEHECHGGVRFLSTALEEQQRTQGIERRGPEHHEEQPHRTLRGAVHIGMGCVTSPAELPAPPVNSQGTPERRGVDAAVRLTTSLGDGDSHLTVHAVLPLFALLTCCTAYAT
jgi:hypothetical protein